MDLELARQNMVEQQIRPAEVLDQEILDLLYLVPREDFVPPAYRSLAFADIEIPLTSPDRPDARMWRPLLEARVLQHLMPRRIDRVLEVGTGSGYLTALLAHRVAQVISVEIDPALAAAGSANLARHRVRNVQLEVGDAARGWPGQAPYDAIVLTGSTPVLPSSLLAQLAPGGRLFAIVGEEPVMRASIVDCAATGTFHTRVLFETVLAPLANCEQAPRFSF